MPYRREDYPDTGELPWLDRPDAEQAIARRLAAGELDAQDAQQLRKWVRDGYIVLPGLLDHATADEINADVQALVDKYGEDALVEHRQEFQDIFPQSAATRRAMLLPELLRWLDLILGMRALPYQTLNLPASSQQQAHSDEVLMTTHPPGHLVAAWFALEDVQPDAGPLGVYIGSHRLPYVSAARVGIGPQADPAEYGRLFDEKYYALIKELVAEHRLDHFTFLGKKGDVLLWHSNALHGAYPSTRWGATRRSLIVHYFGERAEHYSDLWQRPCTLPGLR